MLKATSHAKTKIKTPPGSLLTGMCFYFWIYTATAVHEVDATRLRMRMAILFRALFSILYRSHIISLFEQAVKVLNILVTDISRNGLHRLIGLL